MEYTKAFDFDVKNLEEAGTFEGYASVFGGPPDLQNDILRRGAFTETLGHSRGKVPILMGHQMGRIVGFGIEAEENSSGLRVLGQFTLESDEGRNAYATAKHASKCGHKLGLSIGYAIRPGGAEINDKTGIRTLTAVDLYEYSIAATPACLRARVSRVKEAGALPANEIEEILREAGFSRSEAKRLIHSMKALRDAEPDSEDTAVRAGEDLMAAVGDLETWFAFQTI